MASILDPHGPAARSIADLWWILFAVCAAIYVLVVVLLAYALFHRRKNEGRRPHGRVASSVERGATRWIVVGGIALPAVVLPVLFIFTLISLADLSAEQPPELGIEIVGHQWWWEVRYPGAVGGRTVETANEIHIPVGAPVKLSLLSHDVIHSFWAPALHGKLDLVPGRSNSFWIQADTVGVYRGQCAEYCGVQHARMIFNVVAHPPAEFAAWLAHQRAPAREPHTTIERRGQEVFLESGCAACHAVRGTPALGSAGPDLTHLASRLTLAAGTVPNTKGHLAGWIANPQNIKPGNKMPSVPLSPDAFDALLAYLQILR